MTTEILTEIIKSGGVIGLLVACVIYFMKREGKKDKEIEALNTLLREVEKDNLNALYKVLSYLEKAQERDSNSFSELKRDIEEMRKSIEDKLKDLKDAK